MATVSKVIVAPAAADAFVQMFAHGTTAATAVEWSKVLSPFAAAFNLPLAVGDHPPTPVNALIFWGFVAFSLVYNAGLLAAMMQLFRLRWRISE